MYTDKADGHYYLLGFNDLGDPYFFFFLMDHCSTDFLRLAKKWRKSMDQKFELHHQIPFFLALRLSVRQFQMPLEGLSFVKTLVTFAIITRPTHFYKIWLRAFASVDLSLTISPCRPCWITYTVRKIFKINIVSTRLISETKSVVPIFFAFVTQVTQ